MITVTYRPDKHELTFKGHANSGEPGRDIICAAASMMFYNLCAVLTMYNKDAWIDKPEMSDNINSDTGLTYIRCKPTADYEEMVTHDFQYCVVGFRQLAGNYPQFVNLKELQH